MNKKTLIISGIIAGIIIIGLGLFLILGSGDESTTEKSDKGFFSFLFPESEDKPGEPFTLPLTPDLPKGEEESISYLEGKLIQLTRNAVSGGVFNNETKKVQYFEESTGHLYEIDPQGTNKKQLTITTILRIFEVSWSTDTSMAIIRYLDTETESILEPIKSFLASSLASTTDGVFLPLNTVAAVASPVEDRIFYLGNSNTAYGITSSFENKNKKEVFSSSFGEFLVSWPQENTILLLTKPSASTEGYLFRLNPSTQSFTKILGGIKGLTAIQSPLIDKIIYSQSESNSIKLKLYDLDEQTITNLSFETVPEKCLFSSLEENIVYCALPNNLPKANYPDDWYKGSLSFADTLWQIDLDNGATEMILDTGDLDIINLFLDEEGNFLFFQNKKDYTLWSLNLQ